MIQYKVFQYVDFKVRRAIYEEQHNIAPGRKHNYSSNYNTGYDNQVGGIKATIEPIEKEEAPFRQKFLNPFFKVYWEAIFYLNTDLRKQIVISQTFQAISAYNM